MLKNIINKYNNISLGKCIYKFRQVPENKKGLRKLSRLEKLKGIKSSNINDFLVSTASAVLMVL